MAEALTMCPHCGIDLERASALVVGDLSTNIYGDTYWKGRRIHLTPSEADIVYSLAKNAGQWVKREALVNRLDSSAQDPANIVSVFLCRIRDKFRAIDPSFDCIDFSKGRRSRGNRWRID